MRERQREGRTCVLGLATGSTPISVYAELVRMHRVEGLSFARVTTFNLDECYPLPEEHPQSYRHFMRTHLFDHIDLDPQPDALASGWRAKAEIDTLFLGEDRREFWQRTEDRSRLLAKPITIWDWPNTRQSKRSSVARRRTLRCRPICNAVSP